MPVHQVHKDLLGLLVCRGVLVLLVCKAHKVLVYKELKALRVLLVLLAF